MEKLSDRQLRTVRKILTNPKPRACNPPPPKGETQSEWRNIILEQYKLYVEMSDKVSERRNTANAFFLSANTLLITIFGGFIAFNSSRETGISIAQLANSPILGIVAGAATVGGMVMCITWYRLITRYKYLNEQKFVVIHEIEEHLPIKPYYAEAKIPVKNTTALSNTERRIPIIFGLMYGAILFGLAMIYLLRFLTFIWRF